MEKHFVDQDVEAATADDIPLGIVVRPENYDIVTRGSLLAGVTFLFKKRKYHVLIAHQANAHALMATIQQAFSLKLSEGSLLAFRDSFSALMPLEWAAVAPHTLHADMYQLQVLHPRTTSCCGVRAARLSEPEFGLVSSLFAANV